MNGSFVCLLIFLSVEEVLCGRALHRKYGPYDIIHKHVEDCGGDEDALIQFHLRSRKVSRTQVFIEGYAIINVTCTDKDMKVTAAVEQFTPSGWKDNFLVVDMGNAPTCEVLKKYVCPEDLLRWSKSVFDENNQNVQMPPCEFHPATYTARNLDFGKLTCGLQELPAQFFYGTYRMRIKVSLKADSRLIFCSRFYFDLVPKKRSE